jgi:hypothetical protein
MKKFAFLLIVFLPVSSAHSADSSLNVHTIELKKQTSTPTKCSKLLSPLSIQKTLNFVFPEKYELKDNLLIVNYKNLLKEDRQILLEVTKSEKQLTIFIKKGVFKNLFLTLNYDQTQTCNIIGNLSWNGEEKRFSDNFLEYIIGHYFEKFMFSINRIS